MEKDKKDLLNVIQEAVQEVVSKKPEATTSGFELPAGYLLAKELQEMFDEDIVTHVQGPSEPEAD